MSNRASRSNDTLTAQDRRITDLVDRYLARGLALKRWYDAASASGEFAHRFELAFTFNRPDISYGFFDKAPVDGREMPVLGNLQTQFYDQPKSPVSDKTETAKFLDEQVRMFVLRYFMRVSDFREPQSYARDEPAPPPMLRPFSMCTGKDVSLQGFGYSQLYYKRCGHPGVGKFAECERAAIVDLREIGTEYEWIVVRVRIFDFSFKFAPFGDGGPYLTLPLSEDSYLILTRDFITAEKGGDEELGVYGLGYAFLKNPGPSLLGWGPGEFDAAFQTIRFRVLGDGRIRVRMVFVANRPTSIIDIPLDPVQLGLTMADLISGGATSSWTSPVLDVSRRLPTGALRFDPVLIFLTMANVMTAGLAARELCISREQLEKGLILKHFEQHYDTITGSLQTWRQIRNWLDEEQLPQWVVTGRSA